jgi:hypothetical protein
MPTIPFDLDSSYTNFDNVPKVDNLDNCSFGIAIDI